MYLDSSTGQDHPNTRNIKGSWPIEGISNRSNTIQFTFFIYQTIITSNTISCCSSFHLDGDWRHSRSPANPRTTKGVLALTRSLLGDRSVDLRRNPNKTGSSGSCTDAARRPCVPCTFNAQVFCVTHFHANNMICILGTSYTAGNIAWSKI